jgi:hypothetical protein
MDDAALDSVGGCIVELGACNREVAEFGHEWLRAGGELKATKALYDRLYKEAMRGTSGTNADERTATAHAAVEQVSPGLSERIEELIGTVERHRIHFTTIERRSSNAQSILSAHRESLRMENYVHPEEANR